MVTKVGRLIRLQLLVLSVAAGFAIGISMLPDPVSANVAASRLLDFSGRFAQVLSTDKQLSPDLIGSGDVNVINNWASDSWNQVAQAESYMWVHGNTIVTDYNDHSPTQPPSNTGLSYSTNGGISFNRIRPFTAGNSGADTDPIVAYNERSGKWVSGFLVNAPGCGGRGIGLWTSQDGISWTAGTCAQSGQADRESIWVDNTSSSPYYGRMYISYMDFSTSPASLSVTYSTDFGVTWTSGPIPSATSADTLRNMQITGGQDGTVFIAAMHENGGGSGVRQHVIFRSTDGGISWGSAINIANNVPPAGQPLGGTLYGMLPLWDNAEWGMPAVGPNGVVHYVYAQKSVTDTQDIGNIYYVRSTDNGLTWAAPLRIDNDTLTSHEQWMPSISVTNWGAVTASWYSRGMTTDGLNYQYVVRTSTDNGVTWSYFNEAPHTGLLPQFSTSDSTTGFSGDYYYSYSTNDTAYINWVSGKNQISGHNQQDIYFSSIPRYQPCSTRGGASEPLYLHYNDAPTSYGCYLLDKRPMSPGDTLWLSTAPVYWASPVYEDASFNSGNYTLQVTVDTCQASGNPDQIRYRLEVTDSANMVVQQIGSDVVRSYSGSVCHTLINDTVTFATGYGSLNLQNKKLRVTATLISGVNGIAPNIRVGSGTYLTTPPYVVGPCVALVGHVNWQGRPSQPDVLQQLPLTLTLKSGTLEVNYPVQNTDASGFFTVSVGGLQNDNYAWRVKGPTGTASRLPGFLATSGTIFLTGAASAQVEMGTQPAGDADNDNTVGASDFNILRRSYGLACGNVNYDARADFNGDCLVNAADQNLLASNMGTSGAPSMRPATPKTGK